ncbi:AAA family ATPase [Amycolatopsis azurea]|uniref:AAA family ATPase n=1 Tax=Amycolatopsis azurea TaxID=36819 RepID=UPI00382D6BB9
MFPDKRFTETYPRLASLASPLSPAQRPIVGREREVLQLLASLSRPELCNALLLAEAGTGKTALVHATMDADHDRLYLELDPARMTSGTRDGEPMAAVLKSFFDEAEAFVATEKRELVIFIDEFHQIIQLSAAAAEAIKPVLAASGARGIRIIAATTYEEFHKHVAANQPLVERLQRINLNPPDQDTTIRILRDMAERYGVAAHVSGTHLYRQIYEYTQRYIPASAQPRKAILVLDAMVGWHRVTGRALTHELLADVLMESLNVNITVKVDASKIKEQLDATVLSQDWATRAVARRLQLSVADLNDKGRPEASFLFTGSTGVGKATTSSTPIPVFTSDGSVGWKRAGDLVPGDVTFTRRGTPQKVLAIFPQGMRDVYRVTLDDGRTLDVSDNHLWAVVTDGHGCGRSWSCHSTSELIDNGLLTRDSDGGERLKYFIPTNAAVRWPTAALPIDPYTTGARISTEAGHSDPARADHIHCPEGRHHSAEVLETTATARDRTGIPAPYMTSSIDQRWRLVQGLFDTGGSASHAEEDRVVLRYPTLSAELATDIQHLLRSLGIHSSSVVSAPSQCHDAPVEYIVDVTVTQDQAHRFFARDLGRTTAPRPREVSERDEAPSRHVGIRGITKMGYQEPMVCIYVDDDEHLYLAGEFVVTHNTELTKQLARLLFGDDERHLIRFDMTEFATDESFTNFRSELTKRVWDRSHAVLLFDEIEKASPTVTRVLMQVLDDGRLTDDHHREVSFLNTYIVLTTNSGSEIYSTIAHYAEDDTGSGRQLTEYAKLIRRSISETAADNRFPPELLGRIDTIVPFQPLSRATQRKIVRTKLLTLVEDVLLKHNILVTVAPKVLQYLIDDRGDTHADAGGARTAVARMTDDVTTAVATFINENPSALGLRVDVVGDLVSDDKNLLSSDARIEVSAMGREGPHQEPAGLPAGASPAIGQYRESAGSPLSKNHR